MIAIIRTGAESDREDVARAASKISLTLSTLAMVVERLPAPLADTIGFDEGNRNRHG